MFLIKKKSFNTENILSSVAVVDNSNPVKGSGRIYIKGYFEGTADIDGDIYVGELAFLKADIKSKNLVVSGKVEGEIYVADSVRILPKGSVKGTITSKTLLMERGAKFHGNSVVIDDELMLINHSSEVEVPVE